VVQSVELLLDDAADVAVRAQWQALADAGLPSQARHTGSSNRPHVTLAALPRIDASCEPELAATSEPALPLGVRLGSPLLFGQDPYVLVRSVVVTPALLALHADVARIVGTPEGTNLTPGLWTPHVTLARRLPGELVGTALGLVAADDLDAECVAVRRWDGDAKREWVVAGRHESRTFWRVVGQDGTRQLVVDEDEHACYAYLLEGEEIVADVWLYNVGATPEHNPWTVPDHPPPFANPARLVRSDLDMPLLTDASQTEARWRDDVVELLCDGVLWARLWPGAKPGESRMAAAPGPVAVPLSADTPT
jgi:2'-5' RNA ligase